MPDVTGEQQISHDVTGEQQFLLAASRPIRIEYGTRLWDNRHDQTYPFILILM